MGPAPLKIGENANLLKDFIENYSLYKEDFLSYRYYQSVCRNVFIMFYLFIPAIVQKYLMVWEEITLIVFLVLLSFLWSSLTKLSDYLVFKVFEKISSEKAQRIRVYNSNHKHLKESVEEVLSKGTNSYIEDVVVRIKKKQS